MDNTQHQDLADAYFDGRLDEGGATALNVALQQDPEFRLWFTNQCQREEALYAVLQREAAVNDVISGPHRIIGDNAGAHGGTPQQADARRSSGRRMRSGSRLRRRRTAPLNIWPFIVLAAAASILIIAGITWSTPATSGHSGASSTLATTTPKTPTPSGPVRITAVGPLSATNASVRYHVGDQLAVGDTVNSEQSLTLMFDQHGAQVRLEAGVQASIQDDGLFMNQGGVEVSLPHQAPGKSFRIGTPHARARVVGTTFTMHTSAQTSDLDVQEGTVAWQTPEGEQFVHAGESAQWPPVNTIDDPETDGGVLQVVLMQAATLQTIAVVSRAPTPATIAKRSLASTGVAVQAHVSAEVQSVRFHIQGPSSVRKLSDLEQIPPFCYPGDRDGVIEQDWILEPGEYRITVSTFTDLKGKAPYGQPYSVALTVTP